MADFAEPPHCLAEKRVYSLCNSCSKHRLDYYASNNFSRVNSQILACVNRQSVNLRFLAVEFISALTLKFLFLSKNIGFNLILLFKQHCFFMLDCFFFSIFCISRACRDEIYAYILNKMGIKM